MLKKRVSASIIVRNGIAVQSFGFNSYLPIGDPLICAKNFDRWGADEILIMDISATVDCLGPNIDLITKIGNASISTPLIYAGGIRSPQHASHVLSLGFERIAVTSQFIEDPQSILRISSLVGAQAVIVSLPLTFNSNLPLLFDYRTKSYVSFPADTLNNLFTELAFSELLLLSVESDGYPGKFSLPMQYPSLNPSIPLLLHGGLDSTLISSMSHLPNVSAFFLSNPLLYKENYIQYIKKLLNPDVFRTPFFSSSIKF